MPLKTEIPIGLVRWRRSQIAETFASVRVSASCYRLAEYIRLMTIVEAETELREIQRQIFLAHVVVGADHTAFEQRPKRFHVVRVDFAAHVFTLTVLYDFMRHRPLEIAVAGVFIGRNQINFVADSLAHEARQRFCIGVFDHLADDISLTRDRSDDRNFAIGPAPANFLIPVAISFLTADICFVDFDDAHKLTELRIVHRGAQTMTHIESSLVRTGFDGPMDLKRADSLLASDDHEQHPKPSPQWVFGVLKNGSSDERESVGVPASAFNVPAFPLPRQGDFVNGFALAASRAFHTIRPAPREQIVLAGFLIGKHPLELRPRHLNREFRLMAVALRLHANTIAQIMFPVNTGILALPKRCRQEVSK